jgi:hypothetical protein
MGTIRPPPAWTLCSTLSIEPSSGGRPSFPGWDGGPTLTFRAGGVSGYAGASFGISNVQLSHSAVHGGMSDRHGNAGTRRHRQARAAQRRVPSRDHIGEFSQVVAMTMPVGGRSVRRSTGACAHACPLGCSGTRRMPSTSCLAVNLAVRRARWRMKPQAGPRSSGDRATVS